MRLPPMDYSGVLRLEVETTPAGLPNLVRNPNGDQGAWFWFTPTAGQAVSTVPGGLKFTKVSGTADGYCWTDHMPVTPGHWTQGQVTVTGYNPTMGTTGRLSLMVTWYDANKAVLPSTPPPAAYTKAGTTGTFYGNVVQVPAGAAYARWMLQLERFSSGASSVAQAGDWFTFNRAAFTYAATRAAITGTDRVNLVPNGSFENANVSAGVGSWGVSSPHTLVQATGGQYGIPTAGANKAGRMTSASTAAMSMTTPTGTAGMPVTAGSTYGARLGWMLSTVAGRPVSLNVLWYTAAGVANGTTLVQSGTTVSTGSLGLSGTVTAPAGSAFAALQLSVTPAASGEQHNVDGFLFERATPPGTYFDGYAESTPAPNATTYTFAGTWGASASTATVSTWAYTEPVTWRNILGTAHEIQVDRKAMDAGVLQAVLYDATLDPSTAAEIKPGKLVRVRVAHASFPGGWASVYEGKLATAKASYLRRDDQSPAERVRVDLTATDNIATLANQGESRGVAAVADLPFILEGKGVPWSVNGSGNQVATAAVVSANDSASVLDQVAITRDAALAQAFVDRTNVLVVRTDPTTVTAGFTDAANAFTTGQFSYSDIEIDFSSDNLINEVLVTWLRYNATTKETTEVTYGPYRDQASINQWGARSATYTIHGATESPATIAAYAQTILTANAQPVVRPRRLVMPVKRTADLVPATTYDLGHKVPVVRAGRLNASYVITGISHTFTPELWQVAYEFDPDGSVASPTMTPSPPADPGTATSQAGRGSQAVAAATVTSAPITFPVPFPVPPAVVATLEVSVPGPDRYISVNSITATGCTIRLYSAGAVTLPFSWHAQVPS